MTAFWGPLGWMTLHSISLAYSDYPSPEDKLILKKYMQDFAEVISCPSCKGHFSAMFKRYTQTHPDWADNRAKLFTFVCKVHNTVNKRLDKPRYATAQKCLEALVYATKNTTFETYRSQYIAYLKKNYSKELSGDSMIALAHTREMQKINEVYWRRRDNTDYDFITALANEDMLEVIPEETVFKNISPITPSGGSVGFKLRGGRFTLGSRT